MIPSYPSWRLAAILALILALLGAAVPAQPPTALAAQAVADPDVVPGQYIVVLRDDPVGQADAGAADLARQVEAAPQTDITHVYDDALNGFAAKLSDEAVADLAADPRVAAIVPDRKVYPLAQILTPGADRVDADLNPTAKIDGRDERVDADIAILDMGVGPHPDLNIVGGVDCTGSGTLNDAGRHGTHIAGIAAAKDNADGIVGIAPGARIWSVKVLGVTSGTWSTVICGLDWVTANGGVIDVANLSLGEVHGAGAPSDAPLHRAVQNAAAAGVTLVVAAGNYARDAASVIPARYDEVIAVSAFGDSDGRPGGLGPRLSAAPDDGFASFSDYGQVVDIAAPGVDTRSLAPGAGTGVMSGTSFAAPHVAGAAALIVAAQGRVGPAAVKASLLAAAEPGPVPGDPDAYPEGRLNVARTGAAAIGLSRTSGVPGDTVQVAVSGFNPNTAVSVTWDGVERLSVVADAAGRATAALQIPASTKGAHLVGARSARSTATASYTVRPLVRPTPASGPVGQEVKVLLRGFAARETIDVIWRNGSTDRVMTTVTASGSGTANAYFRIPSALGGNHTLTGDGRGSSLARATFVVHPTLSRSRSSVPAGETVDLYLRGFQAGETVALALVDGDGTTPLTTTTTSSTIGSRNVTVTIPAGTLPGAATVTATGNKGAAVSRGITILGPVSQAAVEPSTPTATASPEPTATETPEVTPTATPSPTPEATIEVTPTPPPPPTEAPTDTPTETPAAPTAAPTIVPLPAAAPPPAAVYPIGRARASQGADSARIALDGDPATAWWAPSGADERPFIQLDLGDVVPIGAIRWLLAEGANPAGMEILVSTDREIWVSLGQPDPGQPGLWQTLATGGLAARHVRIAFDAAVPAPVGGLAEIELLP